MRNKEVYVGKIKQFLEKLYKETSFRTLTVREFSPGNWFKENGVTDTYLPAKILEYLNGEYIHVMGERAGMSIRWISAVPDFNVLAESSYEYFLLFRTGQRKEVKDKPIVRVIKDNVIPITKRFTIEEEVFVMHSNKVVKCMVVGIELMNPNLSKEKRWVKIKLFNKIFDLEADDDMLTIEFPCGSVFKSKEALFEQLTAKIVDLK